MSVNNDTKIITAASESYSESLFALIGSIYANWDNHPPIIVYDIGLSNKSLSFLVSNNIEVKKVEPFCSHWNKHYTWKLWCLNDSDAENIIWMDAGLCVLDNLNFIVEEINSKGYFVVPNFQFLDWEASEMACIGCDLDYSFRIGRPSISANIFGVKNRGRQNVILCSALNIAQNEDFIRSYDKHNRHDQAILSLLFYKHIPNILFNDGKVFAGWVSPNMVVGQKVWAHRRQINEIDTKEFIYRINKKVEGKYVPKNKKSLIKKFKYIFSEYLNTQGIK